jgi:proteasome accessory factor C
MTTAANRFRRLMLLLPSFAESSIQSLGELSARLGIEPATIVADLTALIERFDDVPGFEEPIGIQLSGDTIELTTDHFLRPMRVSMAELCALELGLNVLVSRQDEESALAAQTMERLQQCIASLPQDHRWSTVRSTALHESGGVALDTLRRALRRGRVVRIEYHRPSDYEPAERVVRPYAVLYCNGCWYLVGWCEVANARRLFRIDRMDKVEITERTHDVPEDFDPESLLVDGRPWVSDAPPPMMTVRYSPAIARWIAERDGQPLEADGSAVRTMPLADREWAIRHVLQYGPDAQVLEPEELRTEIRARLAGL